MTISIAVASSGQKKLLNGGMMATRRLYGSLPEMRCGCCPRG